jgi:hypothetical protein
MKANIASCWAYYTSSKPIFNNEADT